MWLKELLELRTEFARHYVRAVWGRSRVAVVFTVASCSHMTTFLVSCRCLRPSQW